MANHPQGREKNVTGPGLGVHRRGAAGTGSVGSGGRPGTSSGGGGGINMGGGSGRPSGGGSPRPSGGGHRGPGGLSPLVIIIILAVAILGGGGSIFSMSGFLGGGDSGSGTTYSQGVTTPGAVNSQSGSAASQTPAVGADSGIFSLLGGSPAGTSTGWSSGNNTGASVDTQVAQAARGKYTSLRGSGKDVVTILVYMCGTDLESKHGMASRDLQEMAASDISDKVNLIVYTGGCKKWKTDGISNSANQIYQITKGKMTVLERDQGSAAMTLPSTLSSFIKYGKKNYPANRTMLILWDHGGGSLSGYGYDEKNSSSGSMTLSGIQKALKDGGQKFDFVGFDACLMATAETGVMLADYADYMIASEETEPGIGWYYTNWLNALSKNTSLSTLDIGRQIVDDFVSTCASQCRGQKTTLSVVDLAALGETLGPDLKAFATSTKNLITGDQYKKVSTARNNSREFAASSKIDQIDLVHFAKNLGTKEGEALAKTLLSAIKYNRTSSNMTNAYGLSAYFPLRKTGKVDSAVATYNAIGLDSAYADCIREFASLEVAGQAVTGGTNTSIGSFLGGGSQNQSSSGGVFDLLEGFLGDSGTGSGSGLFGFLTGRSMPTEKMADYIEHNRFDAGALVWKKSGSDSVISLPREQWELVEGLDLSVYYDDGEGYVDLGLDNVFTFNDKNELVADYDHTWISINNQPVAYYHIDTTVEGDSYTITGRVPCLLNEQPVNLILIFTDKEPKGYIAGADPDYDPQAETETKARGLIELVPGDTLEFLCDFYDYKGVKDEDYYFLGNPMTVTAEMNISNTDLGEGEVSAMYRFTDIYQQQYWTPAF